MTDKAYEILCKSIEKYDADMPQHLTATLEAMDEYALVIFKWVTDNKLDFSFLDTEPSDLLTEFKEDVVSNYANLKTKE